MRQTLFKNKLGLEGDVVHHMNESSAVNGQCLPWSPIVAIIAAHVVKWLGPRTTRALRHLPGESTIIDSQQNLLKTNYRT